MRKTLYLIQLISLEQLSLSFSHKKSRNTGKGDEFTDCFFLINLIEKFEISIYKSEIVQ